MASYKLQVGGDDDHADWHEPENMAEKLEDFLASTPAVLRVPALALYNVLHKPLRLVSTRHRAAFAHKHLHDGKHDAHDENVHKRYEQCKFTKEKGLAEWNIQGEEMMLGAVLAMLSYLDDDVPVTEEDQEWYQYLARAFGQHPSGEGWTLKTLVEKLGLQFDRFIDRQPRYGCFSLLANPHCPFDTQGYVAHNADNVVISFRGSEAKAADWLTNFGIAETSFDPEEDLIYGTDGLCCGQCSFHRTCEEEHPRGLVHEGWYSAFIPVIDEIEEVITPLIECGQPKRIIVCGHSLGGALATACLGWILQRYELSGLLCKHKLLQVTIGQPRFGLESFNAWLRLATADMENQGRFKHARLVRSLDLVPALPPQWIGYKHLHPKILLTGGNEILLRPDDDVIMHVILEHSELDEAHHDVHHSHEMATDHLLTEFLDRLEIACDKALGVERGDTWRAMMKNLKMSAHET
mmetsp:Transcript_19712/g.35687  ORF Transcript_19712/g.35687 Transcript_19712/m.35687 type:complete len:465 (+) Transcript_19712:115-1509(+)